MATPDTELTNILSQWKDSWDTARRVWSPFVKLREPVWCLSSKAAAKEGLTGSFAMIRLKDHRIVIDIEQVRQLGVAPYAVQVLAHEIGHHVYTPANLHDNAGVLTRIQWSLPDIENRAPFVANIYEDLLINDMLHRTKKLDMAVVYQQINKDVDFSELWCLIMRIYEYLWKLKKGTLATVAKFHSPKIDADASLAASLLRSYSAKWLDGAGRFAALLYPYLMEEADYQKSRKSMLVLLDAETAGANGGVISGMVEINPDVIAGAVDPREEALGNANKQEEKEDKSSPFPASGKNEMGGEGPQQRYLNPGLYIDLMKQVNPNADEQELINNYYREIALPHLIDFPVEKSEPISLALPEGMDNWDISDPMEEIDWIESAIHSPYIIPGYNTQKRLYGPDKSDDETQKPLDVYIGIDCSGSMGNPRYGFSWPVLSATIIGLSALRAGARVMGCLSGEPGSFLETKGFSTSEKEVLTVLTSYLGTGYAYGIPRLNTPFNVPVKSKSHVIIVSDDDIFSMLSADTQGKESNWIVIERALKNAGGIGTIVLHSNPEWRKTEAEILNAMGWNIYYVTNEKELLDFAATFSDTNYHSRNFKKA